MEHEAYQKISEIENGLWWYRGRRAALSILLEKHAKKASRILDIGCGTGLNMKFAGPYGKVYGLDTADEAIELCRARNLARLVKGDAVALPFAASTFDLIMALDVVEHVDDDLGTLKGFRRVLSPGGQLVVCVPALPILFGEHDLKVHHKRRYMKGQLSGLIQSAGFELIGCFYLNFFILPAIFAARAVLSLMPNRPHAEMKIPPAPFNRFFTALSRVEATIAVDNRLPVGLTLIGLGRKQT